ncbi:VOC family protein [Streptomyces scabichelini]|nr:VOC family protein [Streptomyces scabichelini]
MDLKTRDIPGTAAFFSTVLGWKFAVDEDDWRRATKIYVDGHQLGGVSDLGNPVYPPGTPAHIAYYLAVDDVDRRTEAATANGAQLVLAPFDAGDQGRMATLIDPVGAPFSLWQASEFSGWAIPPHSHGMPHSMVLACEHPDRARQFYGEMLGTALDRADFITAYGPEASAPQWELVIAVDDLERVAARARDHGQQSLTGGEHTGPGVLRLSSPEGLSFPLRLLAP